METWSIQRLNRQILCWFAAAAAAAKSLQSCPTLCDPRDSSPRGPMPLPTPSLGFSRQEHWRGVPLPSPSMKVKSESEVAQSCPTLRDPMDCSPPGSSVHGIFQARVLEWGASGTIYPYCVHVVLLQGYQPNTWLKYETPYSIALSMNQKCLVIFF